MPFLGPLEDTEIFEDTNIEQLSNEEFWNYAHELASLAPATSVISEQYLRCKLRNGDYLIPLDKAPFGRCGAAEVYVLHEVVPMHDTYKPALFPSAPVWMVGLIFWRGEIIAVIDLDAYLSTTMPENDPSSTSVSILLIAQCSGPPIALLVSTITPTTSPSEAPTLDLCAILEDVEQKIKDTGPA